MIKTKKIGKLRIICLATVLLTSTLFVTSCASSTLPVYVTATNIAFLNNLKSTDFEKYSKLIKDSRNTFESDCDKFYINTLVLSEDEEALSAEGILELNKRENELRDNFDSIETQSLNKLQNYLNSIDSQIQRNQIYLKSVIDEEKVFAENVTKLSIELTALAVTMQEQAAVRRQQKLTEAQAELKKQETNLTKAEFERWLAENVEAEEPEIPEVIEIDSPIESPAPDVSTVTSVRTTLGI